MTQRRPRLFTFLTPILLVLFLAGCAVAPTPRNAAIWDFLPAGYQGYGLFELEPAREVVDGILAGWFPREEERSALLDGVDRVAFALPLAAEGERASGSGSSSDGGEEQPPGPPRGALAVVETDFPALAVSLGLRRREDWERSVLRLGGRRVRYWQHRDLPLQIAPARGGYAIVSRGALKEALEVASGAAPAAAIPTEARLRIERSAGGLYVREPALELPEWLPLRQARLPIREMTLAGSPIREGEGIWTVSGSAELESELHARVFSTLVRFLARQSRLEAESSDADGMLPSLSVEREGTRIDVEGFLLAEAVLEENLLQALRLLGYR